MTRIKLTAFVCTKCGRGCMSEQSSAHDWKGIWSECCDAPASMLADGRKVPIGVKS